MTEAECKLAKKAIDAGRKAYDAARKLGHSLFAAEEARDAANRAVKKPTVEKPSVNVDVNVKLPEKEKKDRDVEKVAVDNLAIRAVG